MGGPIGQLHISEILAGYREYKIHFVIIFGPPCSFDTAA
jgi:hypothetical protein